MKTQTWIGLGMVLAAYALGGRLVHGAPANDNFANRTVLTGTNITITGNNIGASRETGEPNHADVPATHSVWWTWTAPGEGMVTVTTANSDFDTVLAIYSGNSLASLTELAANDDENFDGGIYTSRAQFIVAAGTVCQIAVDGYDGETGNIQLALTMTPAPAWNCANLDGQNVASTNFAGKVIILDFWATWCVPCKAEIPDFIALQNKYGKDGLVIIGLSVDTGGTQLVKDFAQANGINYTMLMANAAVQNAFGGIAAIPTTFIIDRNNFCRARYIGTQSRTTFESAIRPLLYNNVCVQARCGTGQLALAWPTNAAQFLLESTPTLHPPAWSDHPATLQVINGMNTFQLPALQSNRFYRLRLVN